MGRPDGADWLSRAKQRAFRVPQPLGGGGGSSGNGEQLRDAGMQGRSLAGASLEPESGVVVRCPARQEGWWWRAKYVTSLPGMAQVLESCVPSG